MKTRRRTASTTTAPWSSLLALTLWIVGRTARTAAQLDVPQSTTTLVKFVEEQEQLSTFRQVLQGIGVSPSLANTLLAPNNLAFQRWKEAEPRMYSRYMMDDFFAHRRILVLWHLVTEGPFTEQQIFDGQRTFLLNTIGNITVNPVQQTMDGTSKAAIAFPDQQTTDGIVHILDRIIVPPVLQLPMLDRMFQDLSWKFSFNVMANIALFAGLDEELNKLYADGLTFLVPPNRRFNRAEIDVPSLLTPESKDYTRKFVLCHMLPGNHLSATVKARHDARKTEQDYFITMLGTHIWVTTTKERFRFQSVDLLLEDQVTKNGVFHVLDDPLFPPRASDFAAFMHISTTWNTEPCNRMFVAALWTSETYAELVNDTVSVFCPDDDAFGFFNREDYDRLIEPIWRRHLRAFLSDHISSPALTRQEYYDSAPTTITMLSGETYSLRRIGNNPRIGTAEMVFGDMISTDGYFHVINEVLQPPSVTLSIYDHVRFSNSSYNGLTLFATTIDFVQLTDLIDRDYPLTAFIPYNRAFRRIVYPADEAVTIIQQHVARGLLYIDIVEESQNIKPLEGFTLGVEVKYNNVTDEKSIWVGGAKIIQADVFTRNGLFHVIDRVIGREYESPSPTFSPAPTITAEPTKYRPPTGQPIFVPTIPPVQISFPTAAPAPKPTVVEKKPTWSAATVVWPSTWQSMLSSCTAVSTSAVSIAILAMLLGT